MENEADMSALKLDKPLTLAREILLKKRECVEVSLELSRQELDIAPGNTSAAMSLLIPNIGSKGRRIRAAGALSLALGAVFTWPQSRVAALVLGASAAFVAFEAASGWCALRACGVKTKL